MRTGRERGRALASTEQPEDPTVPAAQTTPDTPDTPDTDRVVADTAEPEPTSQPLTADAPVSPEAPTFAELGVREEIVAALNAAGIERTFAIQELTLPLALGGEDVIGQARTGTGKTLGFGVPLLQRLGEPGDGTPKALVVVPTRELCLQVTADLEAASKQLGTRVTSIYGGRPYEGQIAALRSGVDLVVGTPGRLLDLAQQGHLVLAKVSGLVLDEADEMLDLGFLPDVERILGMLPATRQTMLFSATMPGPIITLARTFLTRPTHIRAEQVDASAIGERTAQFAYRAHALDKVEILARVLQAADRGSTMVFTRTKRTASKVSEELEERGFAVGAVHGDLGQGAREQALERFRSGKIDVLVCTDVAARGIDVSGITHVVNYQCPDDAKTYIHRIGRTGRAGRTGIAITLVDWDDLPKWKMISDDLELGAPEPPETYSASPHLYADLGIPTEAVGRIGGSRRRRRERDGEGSDDRAEATSSRAGRGSSSGGDDGEGSGPGRKRRPRSRVRRRSGEVVDGAEDTESAATTGDDDAAAAAPATGDGDGDGDGASRPRRRRRRGGRRGGSGRGADAGENGAADTGESGSDAGDVPAAAGASD